MPNRKKSKSDNKARLHTIVDYFSRSQPICDNKLEIMNMSSSQSCSGSHKTIGGSDTSPVEETKLFKRGQYLQRVCTVIFLIKRTLNFLLSSESGESDKRSPKKISRNSDSKRSSIEVEKPIMKYFFEKVFPAQ
ncbi:ATP-dependent DNA helicase [Caerostris extrusa]|uniref:ATP-dependent DNA helicase n=1 Tax=Caerostris extrusa TaxID=172846 RepID=A0AAV4Y1W8_CAEEX|nr:ATP-dependent DNA helicase [Caerostris extrusa]